MNSKKYFITQNLIMFLIPLFLILFLENVTFRSAGGGFDSEGFAVMFVGLKIKKLIHNSLSQYPSILFSSVLPIMVVSKIIVFNLLFGLIYKKGKAVKFSIVANLIITLFPALNAFFMCGLA